MHLRLTAAALLLAASLLPAQWSSPKTPGIPRAPDGKPDLTAKVPPTADGKPDLSGLWMLPDETYWHDISANLGPEGVPLQPWAAALYKERRDSEGANNPIARCMPAGVPTIDNIPTPFKLIQTPAFIAILYEYNMEYRQIFTDGRTLPRDPNPNWLGYSIGRWDGDTLAVETAGLKDNTWLDLFGHPATDALHVTERIHRRDLMPDNELLEWVCFEGNKGMEHMVGK